jgi:hypothetical protein
MKARTVPAVPSGRSASTSSPLSWKTYISLETMSVASPTPRAKRACGSTTGVRTSR